MGKAKGNFLIKLNWIELN